MDGWDGISTPIILSRPTLKEDGRVFGSGAKFPCHQNSRSGPPHHRAILFDVHERDYDILHAFTEIARADTSGRRHFRVRKTAITLQTQTSSYVQTISSMFNWCVRACEPHVSPLQTRIPHDTTQGKRRKRQGAGISQDIAPGYIRRNESGCATTVHMPKLDSNHGLQELEGLGKPCTAREFGIKKETTR